MIDISKNAELVSITLSGGVVGDVFPELKKSFQDALKADTSQISLDLSGMESLDVSGLQLLLSFISTAQNKNRVLVITGLSDPAVRKKFEEYGVMPDFLETVQ